MSLAVPSGWPWESPGDKGGLGFSREKEAGT